MALHIRWMILRDMEEVHRIEAASFAYPWSPQVFKKVLHNRNVIGWVAEDGGRVLGYAVYAIHRDRITLGNMAVSKAFRREGVGRQIVAKLKTKLAPHRRRMITLLVRETNLPAQLFFREMGFVATEVVRGYYSESNEDAYVMQLFHTPAPPQPITQLLSQ